MNFHKRTYRTVILTLSVIIGSLNLASGQIVPFVNSVDPDSGFGCETVSITGYNFEPGVKVLFGAVQGNVVSATDQLIEAEVPSGATFDHITVVNPSGRKVGYSPSKFLPSFGGASGLSSASFSTPTDLQVSSGLFDVCMCDLDGDGRSEIITTSSGANTVDILKNNSTVAALSFTRNSINLNARTLNVTCGDLNGDAKPDLVFSEGDDGSRLFILQNNSTLGSLSLSPNTYTITGSATKRIAIRDMDFDGRADLVVTDQSRPSVYVVRNTSAGTISFDPSVITLSVPGVNSTSGIAIDDYNGDKRPDILVTQFLNGNGGYFIATNTSSPNDFNFSAFNAYSAPGALFNVISADINKDGKPDFLGSQFTENSMSRFANTTSGATPSFANGGLVSTALRPWGISGGDLDGDGVVDFALGTTGTSLAVSVMHGQGGGSFSHIPVSVNYINRNIQVGDINGDGKPDLIFSSVDDQANAIPASKVSIMLNQKCYQPVIDPAGPFTLCSGNTQQLQVQCIPGASYQWERDGVPIAGATSNVIDADATGAYTVSVTESGGICTSTSQAVDITVKSAASLPSATITANSPICAGQTLTLSSSDVGATEYVWSGPDGFSATGITTSISNFRNSNAGRYYLDIYSGDCLLQTVSTLVEVTPAPEFFVATQSGNTSFCQGETAILEVSPAVSGFSYQWFDGNGAISGANTATYNASSSGNYYAEITDLISGCPTIRTDPVQLDFVAPPTADFNAPSGVCVGSQITFEDNSTTNGSASYLWDFGDGNSSTMASPQHTYAVQNTYTVTLTVSYGSATCQDVVSKEITVADGLVVDMNRTDVVICEGQSVILEPQTLPQFPRESLLTSMLQA
ncbi:MAG: FG-GAP-like repeat-containing protein [Cyclobacteriaceae bacterium]